MRSRRPPAQPAPNRIAAIRERERLSMDRLGELVVPATSGSVINKLEKGRMGLTLEWMHRLARALNCHPNDLLPHPAPTVTREEQAVVELYRGLSEDDRRAAYRVIDAMAKSDATDGEQGNAG